MTDQWPVTREALCRSNQALEAPDVWPRRLRLAPLTVPPGRVRGTFGGSRPAEVGVRFGEAGTGPLMSRGRCRILVEAVLGRDEPTRWSNLYRSREVRKNPSQGRTSCVPSPIARVLCFPGQSATPLSGRALP